MKVSIVDVHSNKVVASIPIVGGIAGYKDQEQHLTDEAWQTALEDGLVKAENRNNYKFVFHHTS